MIQYIISSGIVDHRIFVLPEEKQSKHLLDCLFKHKLINPIITWNFIDYEDVKGHLYFPETTSILKKRFDEKIIKGLDAVYALLIERRTLITVKVVLGELKEELLQMNYSPNALFVMLFDEYNILPDKIRCQITPYNPSLFIAEQLN